MYAVCVDVNMRVGSEFQAAIPDFIASKRRFTDWFNSVLSSFQNMEETKDWGMMEGAKGSTAWGVKGRKLKRKAEGEGRVLGKGAVSL